MKKSPAMKEFEKLQAAIKRGEQIPSKTHEKILKRLKKEQDKKDAAVLSPLEKQKLLEENIKRDRLDGYTYNEICSRNHTNMSVVMKLCRGLLSNEDFLFRRRRRLVGEIIILYKEGKSLESIVKKIWKPK